MNINELKEYAKFMEDENLQKLKIEDGDLKIELEKQSNQASNNFQPLVNQGEENAHTGRPGQEDKWIEIRSKQVGVFYDQPEADSTKTFKKVGDKVEVGDQVGLISAMKIFSDVIADKAGTLREVLVTNGETVEYNQVLMVLEPEED